jgi:hypothetical protein
MKLFELEKEMALEDEQVDGQLLGSPGQAGRCAGIGALETIALERRLYERRIDTTRVLRVVSLAH